MNSPNTIPISLPEINETNVQAVADVIRSGRLALGPQAVEFEWGTPGTLASSTRWRLASARRHCIGAGRGGVCPLVRPLDSSGQDVILAV